ncbi:MAG: radical SAM protein, partial [Candidatus Aenigmatarchaeota archaeon]
MSVPITSKTIDRLKKWKNGGQAGPTNLELYLTNRCNLRCRFCGFSYGKNDAEDLKKELGWKQIERIVEEASELGVDTFFIGGGEPACRSR